MAKRFTKSSINWIELEKKVPLDQKTNFMAFKTKADAYLRRVHASPAEPPKIDWEEYKKIVPVEGLVEKFKSAYTELKVPFPEDTLSAKIDDQWKSLEPEIKSYCDNLQKEIENAKKEVSRINALPKYDDITLEMYHDLFPKEALDPVKRPSFWPHTPEEQPGYVAPEQKAGKEKH